MGLLFPITPPIQKTAVTPGSYTNTNVTFNKYGQATAASNGTGGGTTNNINTIQIDQTPAAGTYGTLSGSVNGSNTVFTVSNNAYVSGSLMVLLNGQEQTQGSSYDWVETTPTSGTFTFSIAPPTGSIVQAVYIKSSTTSGFAISPLATVTGINAKSTGTTALYTVPSGKNAYIMHLLLTCTAATSISAGATASVGYTSSAYSDLYASTAMTGLTTASGTGSAFAFTSVGIFEIIPASSVINLNITSAATGTSQTLAADLMGFIR